MTAQRRTATTVLLLAAVLAAPGPAAAEERVVRIGLDGVRPQVLQAEVGDTVRFVNDDPTFAYRARSTGGPWRFDSGPTALLQGAFTIPSALPAPGTYTYRVAQDAPFLGSVVVGGAPAAASPPPAPTAAPAPAVPDGGPAASPAPPAVAGPLEGSRRDRALGLAVSVAAVLVVGAGSLLLRLLLALPVRPDVAGALRPGTGVQPRW